MTEDNRKVLRDVHISVSVKAGDPGFYITAEDLIDDIEIALVKSPTFKKEIKALISEILK